MTYFKRFLIIFICGVVQIFYATYLLLNLFGYSIDWHISNHDMFMFIPGISVVANNKVRDTRRTAYGDIGDQLDEIYKDIDAWKTRIKKIKDDNPKS